MKRTICWSGLLFVATCVGCAGCAQNTEPFQQVPVQQDAASLGSTTSFSFYNGDAYRTQPGSVAVADGDEALAILSGFTGTSSDATSAVTEGRAGHIQIIVIDQTGGSSTPSQTASATGSQETSANQEPRASIAIPVTVAMPGGVAQGSGAAATEGGTATSTPEQDAIVKYLGQILGNSPDKLSEVLRLLFGEGIPTSQPVE